MNLIREYISKSFKPYELEDFIFGNNKLIAIISRHFKVENNWHCNLIKITFEKE